MLQIMPEHRILIAPQAVDFRKGIDGLVHLCKSQLSQDPFSGIMFIFRNKSNTTIRVLVYDSKGFWLCTKRLSKGRISWWPKSSNESSTVTKSQLQELLLSGTINVPVAHHVPELTRL